MLLINTVLGEHYHSFSPLETTQFDHYIKKNGTEISIKIHTCLVKIKKNNSLHNLGYDYIKKQVFKNQKIGESTFTTHINRLIQSIKEYLILSEIKKENAFIDILWGELLSKRYLRRSQLIRQNNYKIDLVNDPDALLKEYYHKNEQVSNMISSYESSPFSLEGLKNLLDDNLVALKDYVLKEELEWCNAYASVLSIMNMQSSENKPIKGFYEILERGIASKNNSIKISALLLGLIVEESMDYFKPLFDIFTTDFEIIPKVDAYYLFHKLLEFIPENISDPEEFETIRDKLYETAKENNILFNYAAFSVIIFWRDLQYFMQSGRLSETEEIYLSKRQYIPSTEREMFDKLFYSRLAFERKDYQKSAQLLNMKSNSNSFFYAHKYKVHLIMCYIMLDDTTRLNAEQDNLFKHIANQEKNPKVPPYFIVRHKLFIKYSTYLTISRYKSLKDYMKNRIEIALLPSSTYFIEKEWCRVRWQYLKENAES